MKYRMSHNDKDKIIDLYRIVIGLIGLGLILYGIFR